MAKAPPQLTPELARFITPLATAITLTAGEPEELRWQPAKHLRFLSNKIVDTIHKPNGRLAVSMPPRSGKSMLSTIFTPIWYLCLYPHREVIIVGHSKSFAEDFGRTIRNLVLKHKDKLPFGLAADSQAQGKWHTDRGGSLYAVGSGGGLTGKGAHLLCLDDVCKDWDDAQSYTIREQTWEWYNSTARTRLAPGGTIIAIMTRWHTQDLVGKLISESLHNPLAEKFETISLPAVCDQPGDPIGRKIGEALWPERFPIESLRPLMAKEIVWNCLYQQRPEAATKALGNAYHQFSRPRNAKRHIDRDHMLRLAASFDFNVNPMSVVLCQYMERNVWAPGTYEAQAKGVVQVLSELSLKNSNTRSACEALYQEIRRLCGGFSVDLEIYGDPAGAATHTSQTSGSDYQIIKNFFREKSNVNVTLHIAKKAPRVKDRVNCVNEMLCDQAGSASLFIHERCTALMADLENVRWRVDTNGNTAGDLDKSDPERTHISDALGYFLTKRWGGAKTRYGDVAEVLV